MDRVVVGLCMGLLAACILYWERRADWNRRIFKNKDRR
jgi:hypothetical protein